MPREIVFDVSRLATRFSRSTPNGIDRVDLQYAQYFLAKERGARGVLLSPVGPRLIENDPARHLIQAVADHWQENVPPENDRIYEWLQARLSGMTRDGQSSPETKHVDRQFFRRLSAVLKSGKIFCWNGLVPAKKLTRSVGSNAVYFNASQFPVFLRRYFHWLDKRPDVKAVFFIHDVLPLVYPEFFPPIELRIHTARLDVVSKYANGIIVSHAETKDAVIDQFKRRKRQPPPIATVPIAVTPSFATASAPKANTTTRPYFVVLGTVEPRKNHLFLLHLWRELATQRNHDVPLLLIVGADGWDNENVRDLLDRCPKLEPHVVRVQRLTTPALVKTLTNARALLMPSFAEGFGLPVSEALSLGVPVVASNLSCFSALSGPIYLEPDDGHAWKKVILRLSHYDSSSLRHPDLKGHREDLCRTSDIEEFLSTI